MKFVDTLISSGKRALTSTFFGMVRWSRYYRGPALGVLGVLRLKNLVLASSMARRLLLTPDEPRYRSILDTLPHVVDTAGDLELHMLVCERDLLRSIWALKSFFLSSGLNPPLFIHNDGSLSAESIALLNQHFPGCVIPSGHRAAKALADYPMCQYLRNRSVISRKLLDVLVTARADYLIVMDSDILWFSESNQILDCVNTRTPFYVPGIRDAYARNSQFIREHCGLKPGWHVNTGLVGYRRADFLDLAFIEFALDKLVNIPPELVPESLGPYAPRSVRKSPTDPVESVTWSIMEQTLYALLFGRCANAVQLCVRPRDGNKAHPFVNRPITTETALQHYITDRGWNAQFPVGVEYLLRNGFLRKWELHAQAGHS